MNWVIRILLGVVSLAAAAVGHAQSWPSKPVKTIIPYTAGGSVDILVRMLSDKLAQRLGQPFLVEAKPGGATLIATNEVVRATPDGHTLLLIANGVTMMHLTLKTDFDVRRDLQPITI